MSKSNTGLFNIYRDGYNKYTVTINAKATLNSDINMRDSKFGHMIMQEYNSLGEARQAIKDFMVHLEKSKRYLVETYP